jgi:uncharacterized protein (DUF433 family)
MPSGRAIFDLQLSGVWFISWLKLACYDSRMKTYDFTPDQISDFASRRANGESPRRIAEDYSCSGQTIARLLKEHGYWDAHLHKDHGRPTYHFTARQIADMAEQHANGAASSKIAEHYGCSAQTVIRVLKEHDYWDETLRYKTQTTQAQHQEMADRYRSGEGLNALARDYGCTPANIRWLLLKQGVKMRPLGRAPMPPETLEWIRHQRENGASHQSIADALGFTENHIMVTCRKLGLPADSGMSGPEHHAWKGGRRIDVNGYVQVWVAPDDPMYSMTTGLGYVPEHRLVMARSIGRPLTKTETVHHIDGDKLHNDIENLQLRQGNHGKGSVMQCLDCGSHNLGHVPIG